MDIVGYIFLAFLIIWLLKIIWQESSDALILLVGVLAMSTALLGYEIGKSNNSNWFPTIIAIGMILPLLLVVFSKDKLKK